MPWVWERPSLHAAGDAGLMEHPGRTDGVLEPPHLPSHAGVSAISSCEKKLFRAKVTGHGEMPPGAAAWGKPHAQTGQAATAGSHQSSDSPRQGLRPSVGPKARDPLPSPRVVSFGRDIPTLKPTLERAAVQQGDRVLLRIFRSQAQSDTQPSRCSNLTYLHQRTQMTRRHLPGPADWACTASCSQRGLVTRTQREPREVAALPKATEQSWVLSSGLLQFREVPSSIWRSPVASSLDLEPLWKSLCHGERQRPVTKARNCPRLRKPILSPGPGSQCFDPAGAKGSAGMRKEELGDAPLELEPTFLATSETLLMPRDGGRFLLDHEAISPPRGTITSQGSPCTPALAVPRLCCAGPVSAHNAPLFLEHMAPSLRMW
ncbi:hypothetical protein TREES_T100014786 [Tupaia chinensis]|uniref:Uncharacterized protein n=1 Tax=Tupaia chinensis TaxID=246437 RepID=L9KU50_TUPCH|nr:hypothetical protein TREES_T100014786 [Tupaia chinensis]